MSTAVILRGISATGKGTRVSILMEYLKSKFSYESHIIANVPNEIFKSPWQISVFFPEIKTVFIGRWVKSNKSGLMSWNSLDGISGYQDSLYYDLPKYYKGCNIVMEGYFGGKGSHIYPHFLVPSVENTVYFHYLYDDIEELQERCVGRSGSRIKGSCWADNRAYLMKPEYKEKDIEIFKNHFKNTGSDGFISYTFHAHTESPNIFGMLALKSMDLDNYIKDFTDRWQEFSTLRDTSIIEDNHKRFMKYRGGDTDNKILIPIYPEGILNTKTHLELFLGGTNGQ